MRVHASALKHGVEPVDAIRAASDPVFVSDLDDDSPGRQFRLGFDVAGRLLKLVVLRFDSGNELIIHAMRRVASTSISSTDTASLAAERAPDRWRAIDRP